MLFRGEADASGDLREAANIAGWPTQVALEAVVTAACEELGWTVTRANEVDPRSGHGFISSQRMGLEVFKRIPVDAPLIVAEAVWQYSHHVLAGLRTHRGPILTVANFEGKWPGLHLDIGRADAVELPAEETERRWSLTNPEWPIMHVVLHGVSRDQFMARHKANHVQIAYAPDAQTADRALAAKAAAFSALGVAVHLCGDIAL